MAHTMAKASYYCCVLVWGYSWNKTRLTEYGTQPCVSLQWKFFPLETFLWVWQEAGTSVFDGRVLNIKESLEKKLKTTVPYSKEMYITGKVKYK